MTARAAVVAAVVLAAGGIALAGASPAAAEEGFCVHLYGAHKPVPSVVCVSRDLADR